MNLIITVRGKVQGVGFRYLVKTVADKYGLSGIVRNVPDGSVEIMVSGPERKITAFRNEIDVNMRAGPSVTHTEQREPKSEEAEILKSCDHFVIELTEE